MTVTQLKMRVHLTGQGQDSILSSQMLCQWLQSALWMWKWTTGVGMPLNFELSIGNLYFVVEAFIPAISLSCHIDVNGARTEVDIVCQIVPFPYCCSQFSCLS